MRLLIRFIANVLGLLVVGYILAGVTLSPKPQDILLLAFFITLANLILRPLLKIIFLPLLILTLGLFTIIINALILGALDVLFESITIEGPLNLILATVVIGIVNFAVSVLARGFKRT